MHALRLYGRYASASLRGQMQYRGNLAMQTVGAFLVTGVDFVGIWALFHRFGQIRGWRLPEVALFYGMISIAFALCDAIGRGFDIFGQTVKAGNFDRLLLRPRSTVLQLLGQELTLRRVGRLAQGLVVLGYAFVAGDIDWTAARALLFAGAITGAALVFMGLLVLQATSAFWTTETLEVWSAFTYGGVTMSQYPLDIYRPWFRGFFTYVIPLGGVCFLPGLAILGRDVAPAAAWLSLLAGPAFLGLALLVWGVGVRRYRSTGS